MPDNLNVPPVGPLDSEFWAHTVNLGHRTDEPSLKEMVEHYYRSYSMPDPMVLASRYMQAFRLPSQAGEGAGSYVGDVGDLLKRARNAVRNGGTIKNLDHANDVVLIDKLADALEATTTPPTDPRLDRAIAKAVEINAFNADDPLAIRIAFESQEDRLAAANAIDRALASIRGEA